MNISSGIGSFLWFLAIVALIPASLWFLKRTPLGGGGGNGVLKSVAAMPLSTSQRIVTVEVGAGTERQWLILGVTPGSITTYQHSGVCTSASRSPTPSAKALCPKMKKGTSAPSCSPCRMGATTWSCLRTSPCAWG